MARSAGVAALAGHPCRVCGLSLTVATILEILFALVKGFVATMPEKKTGKRGPGRPRIDESEEGETIRLRVKGRQAERYRIAAESRGESFSAWARRNLDRIATADLRSTKESNA